MTHHLHCSLQQHLTQQNSLLLPRVTTQGVEQIGLTVAQRELDDVFTNKSRIAVHVESSRTVGNWVSCADAVLGGLHPAIRGDQCLAGSFDLAKDQVISGHVQAFADQAQLADVRIGVTKLPTRNGRLHQIRSANTQSNAEFGLTDAVRTPYSSEARTKAVWLYLARLGANSLLGGPLAYGWIVEAGEPFVFELAICVVYASLDQASFARHGMPSALNDMEFDQLNTHAGNAISVGSNPRCGVKAAPNLDISVAKVADVEVFHGSIPLLRTLLALGHEQSWISNLDMGGDPALKPVLHTLNTTMCFVVPEQLGNFGWAAKGLDK